MISPIQVSSRVAEVRAAFCPCANRRDKLMAIEKDVIILFVTDVKLKLYCKVMWWLWPCIPIYPWCDTRQSRGTMGHELSAESEIKVLKMNIHLGSYTKMIGKRVRYYFLSNSALIIIALLTFNARFVLTSAQFYPISRLVTTSNVSFLPRRWLNSLA